MKKSIKRVIACFSVVVVLVGAMVLPSFASDVVSNPSSEIYYGVQSTYPIPINIDSVHYNINYPLNALNYRVIDTNNPNFVTGLYYSDHGYSNFFDFNNYDGNIQYDMKSRINRYTTNYVDLFKVFDEYEFSYYVDYDSIDDGYVFLGDRVLPFQFTIPEYVCHATDGRNELVLDLKQKVYEPDVGQFVNDAFVMVHADIYQYENTANGLALINKGHFADSFDFTTGNRELSERFRLIDNRELNSQFTLSKDRPIIIKNIQVRVEFITNGYFQIDFGANDNVYTHYVGIQRPLTYDNIGSHYWNTIDTYQNSIIEGTNLDASQRPIISFENVSLVDWLVTQINSFMQINFLPNISFGALIWFVVGLGLFFFILKMFMGG